MTAEEGPGRVAQPQGLAFPGDQGDCWGNATHIISKGAQNRDSSTPPFPPPKCPHTPPEEEVSNSDDEIAACLGRVAHRGPGMVGAVLTDRRQRKAPGEKEWNISRGSSVRGGDLRGLGESGMV